MCQIFLDLFSFSLINLSLVYFKIKGEHRFPDCKNLRPGKSSLLSVAVEWTLSALSTSFLSVICQCRTADMGGS